MFSGDHTRSAHAHHAHLRVFARHVGEAAGHCLFRERRADENDGASFVGSGAHQRQNGAIQRSWRHNIGGQTLRHARWVERLGAVAQEKAGVVNQRNAVVLLAVGAVDVVHHLHTRAVDTSCVAEVDAHIVDAGHIARTTRQIHNKMDGAKRLFAVLGNGTTNTRRSTSDEDEHWRVASCVAGGG